MHGLLHVLDRLQYLEPQKFVHVRAILEFWQGCPRAKFASCNRASTCSSLVWLGGFMCGQGDYSSESNARSSLGGPAHTGSACSCVVFGEEPEPSLVAQGTPGHISQRGALLDTIRMVFQKCNMRVSDSSNCLDIVRCFSFFAAMPFSRRVADSSFYISPFFRPN